MNILRLYRWSDLPRMAGWVIAYVVLARIALTWFSLDGEVALIWPPSGLAVAALLVSGKRYWPAIFAAELIQSSLNGRLDMISLPIAAGCTLEALTCTWLLSRCRGFGPALRQPQDYMWLVLAGAISAFGSAAVGVLALLLSGNIPLESVPHNLLSWWQGNVLGIVFVTPTILVWRRLPSGWLGGWRTLETIAFCGATFLVGQILFLGWFHTFLGPVSRGYWMFPLVVWGAARYRQHGVLLVVMMVTMQATAGAILGKGFFGTDIAETRLTNQWVYLFALGATGITLALAINRRRLTEEKFRSIFEHSSDAIVLFNGMYFFDCNDRALALFGLSSKAELYGCHPGELSPPMQAGGKDSMTAAAEHVDAALRNGVHHFEWLHRRKNGEVFPSDVLLSAFTYDGQRILQATIRDISEQKRWQMQQRFHLALESSQDGFYIIDRESMRFINANEAAYQSLGYALDELLTMGPHMIMPEFSREAVAERFDEIINSPKRAGAIETYHRRKDGALFPVEVNLRAIMTDGRWLLTAIARDVTQRWAMQQELERQARTDYLTGLLNRGYFMELAEQELSRASRYGARFSVLLLDIDYFKAVNDTYGHKVGDQVLQRFAELCRAELREVDIFGRMGGEEFAILLTETDDRKAFEVADRLRLVVANSEITLQHGLPLRFTVSIGVAFFNGRETNIDSLINQADEQLYRAKHEGRNRVCGQPVAQVAAVNGVISANETGFKGRAES